MSKFKLHVVASLLLFFALCAISTQAQLLPDWGDAFPQNEVTSVHITIDPDSLQYMIDMQDNQHYYPASFSYTSANSQLDFAQVGLRIKGGTSLNASKLSFKISTDEFVNNELSEGMNIMNLVSQLNDPSLMRSKLCHDFYRMYHIPSARTNYTRLYINDEYRGLYLNVEEIDDVFVQKYFSAQGDGNLYKCSYPADLNFIGNNPDAYKLHPTWSDERTYNLKTNKSLDDYSGLAHFIDVLTHTSVANLECELPQVFNVESYLKVMAIDVLTGNWDGYAYNKNNYFLYEDPHTGQFNFIPYDLDNTFGIDWLGLDWGSRNIYNWPPSSESRPLFTRILQVPSFRARFGYHITKMMEEYFNESAITSAALNWQNLIESAAEEDTYRVLDYGFDMNDFYDALNTAELGTSDQWHLPYGIIPYVIQRAQTATTQLENFSSQTAFIQWIQHRNIAEGILIEALIEGPLNTQCQIRYSTDNINYSTADFFDNNDYGQVAGDGIFSFLLPAISGTPDQYFYQGVLPNGSFFPCAPSFLWLTPSFPMVHINEVMPLNHSIISDEAGVFEDWVELYNSTGIPINLEGAFLSDDSLSWYKFPLPDINIPAHGFVLFWLDRDHSQGQMHANFKLAPDESIYLTTLESGEPRMTDMMENLPDVPDVSLELTTDGGPVKAFTNTPTPGYSNEYVSVANFEDEGITAAFPNPANAFIHFSGLVNHVELTDASGRVVLTDNRSAGINTSSVANGMYYLKMDNIIVRQLVQH